MRKFTNNKFMLLLAVFLFITGISYPQGLKDKKLGIGMGAGLTTGVGFTLKNNLTDNFSFSVTLLPPIFQDNLIIFTSAGLAGYYNFITNEHNRFFSYASTGWFYDEYKEDNYNDYGIYTGTRKITESDLHIGTGIGFELFSYNLSASIMAGYGLFMNNNFSDIRTSLTIEASLIYYFKDKSN